jgi:hypothetical protein
MVKSGFSRCKISDVLKIPRLTVIGVAHKSLSMGSVENKWESGRPLKIQTKRISKLEQIVNCNHRSYLHDITN